MPFHLSRDRERKLLAFPSIRSWAGVHLAEPVGQRKNPKPPAKMTQIFIAKNGVAKKLISCPTLNGLVAYANSCGYRISSTMYTSRRAEIRALESEQHNIC